RNAAIPITTIAGITIASLIAVAAVVEVAFSLNGLGAYLVQSAQSKDLAVVQGISLVLVTAFVLVNLLVDVMYAVLDPRVALGRRARCARPSRSPPGPPPAAREPWGCCALPARPASHRRSSSRSRLSWPCSARCSPPTHPTCRTCRWPGSARRAAICSALTSR